MAETPFSPEPGASGSAPAPEEGGPGQVVEPVAEATEGGDLSAPHDTASAAPLTPAAAPEPPGASPAQQPAIPAVSPEAPVAGPETAPEAVASPATSPETAAEPPGVAATIAVPPLEEEQSAEGGGEWEMLVERINAWWSSGELARQWQRIRGPLKGVAILVGFLLALRLYATVVSTIDAIPLVSGLLELTGLIAVLQFGATRLLRSSDRQEVLAQWRRRWLEFRGRD